MRVNRAQGVIVKQVSAEVPVLDHDRLKRFSKQEGRSVQDLVSERLLPWIRQLPEIQEGD